MVALITLIVLVGLFFVVIGISIHLTLKNEKHSKYVLAKVFENSTKLKEIEKLNSETRYHDLPECVGTSRITAKSMSEFNMKTANLPQRLFRENPQLYLDTYDIACDNYNILEDYEEKLKKIKPTDLKIIEAIEGVSIDEFHKFEDKEFKKRKLKINYECYVLVKCKYQNRSQDDLKIDFHCFIPIIEKYCRNFVKNNDYVQSDKSKKQGVVRGLSVIARIESISQPYGGYLNIKNFKIIKIEDDNNIKPENIHSSLVGLSVDYLCRFMSMDDKTKSFDISLLGAKILKKEKDFNELFARVKGLDDESIIAACKLSSFDVAYRAGSSHYKSYEVINPDVNTIENIRIMVNRSLEFFKKYGPVTKYGFTFEKDGYTDVVSTGDGDFLTQDTLWDFKTISKEPTSKHTLQILMYYIMGKHSKQECYKDIDKIGIFNPRLNKVYIYDVGKMDREILRTVEKDIICYKDK